jgi:hypothetical protein
MEIILPAAVAFLAAILTFFSGFGLGTLLTPVFAIFFPIELAIALTGAVHFFNNIFKLFLVGKKADKQVLIRFGIPAVAAAFIGAWVLGKITKLSPLFSYQLGEKTVEVYPVKFVIAILLIVFAVMDLIPYFSKLQFGKDKLPLGGVLSGFFGGLSGHQGALRSAFLIKAGLSKEAFIGTAVVVSTFVDFTRLSVYANRFSQSGLQENITIVVCTTLAAISGAFVGNKMLKKITLETLRITVAVLLIIISIALGFGII